jgi:two-component system nitrogen regulation sensor histidine kinase GlnL
LSPGRDLSTVLDAVLDGVIVLDREGDVELVNNEACRILETSATAALGAAVEELLGAEHPVARLARSVLSSGRTAVEAERAVSHRFEADLIVDVAAAPLFERGHLDGVVVMLRDRTIRASLQERVSERERLDDFGRIAAGIAHEVKNPLGGIRGAAEILASRASDAKTLDAAELIVREVGRIAALIDDLMVFARSEELETGALNIHRVLDDVLDLLAMDPLASGIEVERAFDPSLPEIRGDSNRLTQVFHNLVRNALQAMEGRGQLTITTRMALRSRLSTPDGRPLPTLLVEIADDGPGIPPEVLGRLATPFFTTRAGGTGLGLAVSRHWVNRHDGALHIDSAPGHGTRVRVTLPMRRPL